MEKISWIFIGINVLGALGLVIVSTRPGQDAAGKAMVLLPIILLLGFAGLAWLLLRNAHPVWSMIVSGLPVLVMGYMLYLNIVQGKSGQ